MLFQKKISQAECPIKFVDKSDAAKRWRGLGKMLVLAGKGGRGVGKMLTLDDQGGSKGSGPPFLTDIVCE